MNKTSASEDSLHTLSLLALFGAEPGVAVAPLRLRSTKAVSALASAVAMCLSASAQAQQLHHPEKPTYDYEKCYGVAAGGRNDCFTAANSCGGAVPQDRRGDAWIYLPKGSCERIDGGNLEPNNP